MPFFRDVAVGCYVRVGIGAHEGRMVYRVSAQCHSLVPRVSPLVYTHIACLYLHVFVI